MVEYDKLLQSPNYVTKRQSLKLLGAWALSTLPNLLGGGLFQALSHPDNA